MRNQARGSAEDQQKLTEQLEAGNQTEQHSLRDSGERKQVREGLEQQEKRLDQLLEQMRRTVQDAEESEPLLAKELYDTVRKAGEQKIPDALKVSQQLVDLGVSEDAAKASRHAGQGLEQLREGVERAARSVLGDETAALERPRASSRTSATSSIARSRRPPETSRRIGMRAMRAGFSGQGRDAQERRSQQGSNNRARIRNGRRPARPGSAKAGQQGSQASNSGQRARRAEGPTPRQEKGRGEGQAATRRAARPTRRATGPQRTSKEVKASKGQQRPARPAGAARRSRPAGRTSWWSRRAAGPARARGPRRLRGGNPGGRRAEAAR